MDSYHVIVNLDGSPFSTENNQIAGVVWKSCQRQNWVEWFFWTLSQWRAQAPTEMALKC